MSTNTQLQKIAPPKIRRLRHRRRLVAGSPRVHGRHPALDNFLIREAARANATGGVVGVTEAEILAAVEGVGTSDKNRDIGDAFDIQVSAQYVRAATLAVDYTNAGIPVA
jgi:hypothetical protein